MFNMWTDLEFVSFIDWVLSVVRWALNIWVAN